MTESNGKRKVPPHHRLTLEDVRADRLAGLLTAKGAIFYSVIASYKAGTPIRINPRELAARLSISRTSFYDAIAKLKLEGRIDFEAEGDLIIRVPIDEKTGIPHYLSSEELSTIPDSQSTIPDSQSTIPDSQSTIPDSQSTIPDSQSAIPDSQSAIPDSKPSKTLSSNGSSAPLSIQSLQSIQSLKERENAREEEENGDRGFRDWLFNRANSLPQKPALMEQWIDKEMLKAANKREFAQYQASMAVTPLPAIPQPENIASNDYWAAVEARRNGNG